MNFEHDDKEYLFVEYVFKNYNLVGAIKTVFKLKNKNNDLYLVLSMIIDQFNTDPKKDKKRRI